MNRIWLNVLPRHQCKGCAQGECGEEQVSLHHGEMVSDADARPRAKGDVGVAGKLFLSLWSKALRIELLRLGKVVGPAMHRVGRNHSDIPFGEQVAVNLDIVQRLAAKSVSRRIETHRLLEDLQTVGQPDEIGVTRCAPL